MASRARRVPLKRHGIQSYAQRIRNNKANQARSLSGPNPIPSPPRSLWMIRCRLGIELGKRMWESDSGRGLSAPMSVCGVQPLTV